jgi:hypothetical protein
LYACTLCFGVREAFTIIDRLAKALFHFFHPNW